MEKSDWSEIVSQATKAPLSGALWRVVESQIDIATNDLVDTLEEQAALEIMLEDSKPPVPEVASDIDYLLATPFRYPPLNWGSRFGSKNEASLYYGSQEYATAFAELAYYRFVFRSAMDTEFPNPRISTNHTLFSANYEFLPGIDLTVAPFRNYSSLLADKSNYSASQSLGQVLRSENIQGFYFLSARCPDKGTNIAIFTPQGLRSKAPELRYQCYCEMIKNQVTIKLNEELFVFPRAVFLVKGQLPAPA